jgi:tetratricopeptide (TPR) repeat protein
MEVSKQARTTIQLSLGKKLLFSTAITVAFLLLLELVLVLSGLTPVTMTEDPFVGFSGNMPLMELAGDGEGKQVMVTAKNKRRWFNAQSFPKNKPAGTKRIFCMGGSTTYGHPFTDSTSFSRWMREFLPVCDPAQKWEVINAGGISYASYRVAALMEELSQYQPDVFVVYSVHNEFLERRTYQDMFEKSKLHLYSSSLLARTRTWTMTDRILKQFSQMASFGPPAKATQSKRDILQAEVDEMLNHTIGPVDYHRDLDWRAKVVHHYETNLRRMVAIARRAGAQIVFVTPASNEKDCSPFKSEHDAKLPPEDRSRLEELFLLAAHDFESANALSASTALESAIAKDSLFAEYHFHYGRLMFSLQRYAEAQKSFVRALNEDVCPLRAVDEIRQSIDRVGREERVPIVDFEQRLRRLSQVENGYSILGEEYFLDHVHPTIDVNRRLALWIIEELQSHGIVQGTKVNTESISNEFSRIESKVLAEIDVATQGLALRNLAKVLHWAGKYDEATPRARDVLELIPNDPESRFILADCLTNTGRPEQALIEYEKLFANGQDYIRASEAYGQLLAVTGNFEQAKAYLLLAILHNEKSAAAYYWLGLVHIQLEEYPFAEESLEQSNRLFPDDAETLFYLAQAKAGLGKHLDAISLFEKVLSKKPREAKVHYCYAASLLAENRAKDARTQFETALQLAPEWKEAREQLDRLVQEMPPSP